MTEPRVKRFRHDAAVRQRHRCFYCGFPIWEAGLEEFAKRHHISPAEARRFFCTAEHLHARGDGGTSRATNIVAACSHCNHHRHQRKKRIDAQSYAALVKRRVGKIAWHPSHLHRLMTLVQRELSPL